MPSAASPPKIRPEPSHSSQSGHGTVLGVSSSSWFSASEDASSVDIKSADLTKTDDGGAKDSADDTSTAKNRRIDIGRAFMVIDELAATLVYW